MLSRIFSPSPATATLSAADSVPTGRWLTWSVCWGAEETAHTLCFWSWMVCLLFSVVLNFFQNSKKKNPKQTTEKKTKQTVASATCARERGVKEVRCVCCAVFCSNSSSSSCGRVCLPLALSPPSQHNRSGSWGHRQRHQITHYSGFSQLFAPYGRNR